MWEAFTVISKNKMHTFQLNLKDLEVKIKLWNKQESRNICEENLTLEDQMHRVKQCMILQGRTTKLMIEEVITLYQLQK